jgi:hypothetical protein
MKIQFNQELKLNNWTVIVEEDLDTGNLVLPLPQDMLNLQGWVEGDTLEWIDQKDGSWQLKKVDTTNEKSV